MKFVQLFPPELVRVHRSVTVLGAAGKFLAVVCGFVGSSNVMPAGPVHKPVAEKGIGDSASN
jgi:hypothetical protein